MDQLTIAVTADHIARGAPKDCGLCAISLAVADAFPGRRVRANQCTIVVRDASGYVAYETPPEAADAMYRLDAGELVEPFAFPLGEDNRINRNFTS